MGDVVLVGESAVGSRYKVVHRRNCVLIDGVIPLGDLGLLAKKAPHGTVIDSDLARLTGSSYVFGLPEDLELLRKELESEVLAET